MGPRQEQLSKTKVKTTQNVPPIHFRKKSSITTIDKTSKTKTKPIQQQSNTKSKTNTKKTTTYAGNPDYEYDTLKNRWVKKSDIRPIELVNQHKTFLIDYLKKHSKLEHKEIEKLIHKHSTSEKTLSKILVEKGVFTQKESDVFFQKYNFWQYVLCKHMKKICPTDTDLSGRDWCVFHEDVFCYFKDPKSKLISCYSIDDIFGQLEVAFSGGDNEDVAIYQLPRDPYTRKVWTEEFIKNFLKQLRYIKARMKDLQVPHVIYFLRHYKRFYADPKIKPFLKKTTLTKEEKWKVSDAIEEFMTKTDEIEPDLANGPNGPTWWWFWNEETGVKPVDKMEYVFRN